MNLPDNGDYTTAKRCEDWADQAVVDSSVNAAFFIMIHLSLAAVIYADLSRAICECAYWLINVRSTSRNGSQIGYCPLDLLNSSISGQ
jgi:hypothetical protein